MWGNTGFEMLDEYGTEKPLVVPERVYTNETSTAQSVPLSDRVSYTKVGVDAKNVTTAVKPNISPQNPAAPDPKTPTQDNNAKAFKNPVLWIGVAAGVFGLFWLVKHA